MPILNPELYQALQELFGEVEAVNEGQTCIETLVPDPKRPGHKKREFVDSGENYRVNCPNCGDTRVRLYFHHMMDPTDPEKAGYNFTWHCFNENCETDPMFRRAVLQQIKEQLIRIRSNMVRPRMTPRAQIVQSIEAPQLRQVALPSDLIPLTSLPDDHAWIKYLKGRDLDPAYLASGLHASIAGSNNHSHVRDRLVIPFVQNGHVVGWQARFLGSVKGRKFCERCYTFHQTETDDENPEKCSSCGWHKFVRDPKWFTASGSKKSKVLLNWDVARHWPYLVIVEGPFDVARVASTDNPLIAGPAVGIFGSVISRHQAEMIATQWASPTKQAIFVLGDYDANQSYFERGLEKPPKTLKTMQLLHQLVPDIPIYNAVPPADAGDPGDMQHSHIWKLLMSVVKEGRKYVPSPV